jgi:hypothetical protein
MKLEIKCNPDFSANKPETDRSIATLSPWHAVRRSLNWRTPWYGHYEIRDEIVFREDMLATIRDDIGSASDPRWKKDSKTNRLCRNWRRRSHRWNRRSSL